MTLDTSSLQQGLDLRDRGADRAVDHANRITPEWGERAFVMLCTYARVTPDFMIEDVREFAEDMGLPAPPDARAWGGVTLRAAKQNLIKRIGYRPMRSPNCHANPKSVWKWIG